MTISPIGWNWPRAFTPIPPGALNQTVVNAFAAAFGQTFRDVVQRAGLESMAIPGGNRNQPYAGPAIAEIANLSDDERAALSSALAAELAKG
ncbi:MAG: hypothetical protein HY784_03445 [Chloroflexi bacterium]|nr:hypothetical protein [Chloroflexota bacterium]